MVVFDAYTIKKMVPRLVLAVILVNLSWVICLFLLEFSNILGETIESILLAPFQGLDNNILSGMSFVQQGGIVGLLLGGAAAVTLFSSWAIFVPTLLAGLLGLIIGYLTLVLRQVVVILLIILSPIAIALWVIPGTESYAKKWFSIYFKTLLMYPLIVAFLISGQIMSAIIVERINDDAATNLLRNFAANEGPFSILFFAVGGVEEVVLRAAALAALFAPYFMIPITFKMVGGAIASIGGFFNDRTKGMLDLKRKSAHEKGMANRRATMSGTRFDDGRMFGLGKHANKFGSYVARPGMALTRATGGRMGVRSRAEYMRATDVDRAAALEKLQKEGILDHDVGNEMAVHWGRNSTARARIAELRRQAQDARDAGDEQTAHNRDHLATRLERVQDLTGEKYQLAGMDMANSFGKLDDRSLLALNDIYGNDDRGKAMKALALGRLREQGKGKGNYTTFAAYQDQEGFVHSYGSTTEYDDDGNITGVRAGGVDQRSADRLATALQDAGPGLLGQTKQYDSVDDSGRIVSDTKSAHMNAVARIAADDGTLIGGMTAYNADGSVRYGADGKPLKINQLNMVNGERQAAIDQRKERAMEQLIMLSQEGAYDDANTKVAADRAIDQHINRVDPNTGKAVNPALKKRFEDKKQEILLRGRMGGVDPDTGQPIQIGYDPAGPAPRRRGGGGNFPQPPVGGFT